MARMLREGQEYVATTVQRAKLHWEDVETR